ERDGGHLRPALRQLERHRVLPTQADVVGDQHHRREGDSERGEDDVEAEGEGHLLAGGEQIGRAERHCEVHHPVASRARPGLPRRLSQRWRTRVSDAPTIIIATFVPNSPRAPHAVPASPRPAATPTYPPAAIVVTQTATPT